MKYADGIELVLGDGIEWLKAQPDGSLDGIFTDPPWGCDTPIVGQANWLGLIGDCAREARRVLKDSGKLILWVGTRQLQPVILALPDWRLRLPLYVWRVPARHWGRLNCNIQEIILWYDLDGDSSAPRYAYDCIRYASTGIAHTAHPASREPRVARWLIETMFSPGDVIADPFGGSATMACAAADLGVRCTSVEIDPAMHATAVTRVEGRTPNLICPAVEHGEDASLFADGWNPKFGAGPK